MEDNNSFNVFTIVFFIGVILFFGIYFSFSALWGFEVDNKVDSLPDQIVLKRFSDAVFRNKEQNDHIKLYNYKLFSVIDGYDVIIGEDDFLFQTVSDDGTYNYILDYLGKSKLTKNQLDIIAKSLQMRKQAYDNHGISYMIAVVPNSHTVYRENLPGYFDNLEPDTSLMQLTAYMEKNTDVCFVNLTDSIVQNKSQGLLYNNTENSINSKGAFFAYREIFNNIPSDITAKITPNEFSDYYYCTNIIRGKSIAQKIELQEYIKNYTVSLSDETVLKYAVKSNLGIYEYSTINVKYKDKISTRPMVMIECSDEWNKTQFIPYFSNTFYMVTYKNSYTFNRFILDNQNITSVIQIINEDELMSLLDENTTMSYTPALKPDENLFVTATPSVISRVTSSKDVVSIIGTAENNAIITVLENKVETKKVMTIDGQFIISFYMGDALQKTVYLSAQVGSKNSSSIIQVNLVKNATDYISSAVVGENSQIYSAVPPNNIFTKEIIANLKNKIINNMEIFFEVNGRYPSFYCLPVPEKERILNEDLPESLIDKYQMLVNSNLQLSTLACKQVKMLDASKELMRLKNGEKLFMQTYSSLSDIGAFYCYREIALGLKLVRSNDSIINIDSYNKTVINVESGELISQLKFDDYLLVEKTIKLDSKFINKATFTGLNQIEYDVSQAFISNVADPDLPVAIIVRDDNSADKILPFLAEHFSTMIVLESGVSPDGIVEYCISQAPDMVIYLASSSTSAK